VPASSRRSVGIMQTATALAVAATLVVALVGGPLWELSERIAVDLLGRTPYIEQVLR
jgi:multicomponent Na+:H+ antiporter subunit D